MSKDIFIYIGHINFKKMCTMLCMGAIATLPYPKHIAPRLLKGLRSFYFAY